jgi:ribonuclease HII
LIRNSKFKINAFAFEFITLMFDFTKSQKIKKLWKNGRRLVIGVDEVGRGSLAGPVVAAACTVTDFRAFLRHPLTSHLLSILIKTNKFPRISTNFNEFQGNFRDSKSLTPKSRELAFSLISQHPYLIFCTSKVSPQLIDRLNIRRATLVAMRRATLKLLTRLPVTNSNITLLVDGRDLLSMNFNEFPKKFPRISINFHEYTYIKGDQRIFLIALASIIAKVTRDRLMTRLALKFPHWKFEKHKGYATPLHKRLITTNGPSPIHRKTFIIK